MVKQDFRENLHLAIDTIRSHKLRSFLAVLGVMIGVALIILVVGLVQGFRSSIEDELMAEGADTAWISRFEQGPRVGRRPKDERLRKPLTLEDGLAVRELCPAVKQIAISVFQWELAHNARYQNNQVQGGEFRGTFPAYLEVYSNASMKVGRFFTEAENDHRDNVVVLGENTATALFHSVEDAMDKEIIVDGSKFLVIGVLQKQNGGFGTNDEDRRIVIPFYTFFKLYPGSYEIAMRMQAYPGKLNTAVDQIREVLRRRRNVPYAKPDDFFIQTNIETMKQFDDIIQGVVLAIVVLSSIGLLIGGMGVMNIMLVSVTERTKEIGVRKAIGARRSDITWQFLFEAMTLTGTGGLIGILFGSGLVSLIPVVTTMKAVVPLWAVIVGFSVSVTIGLVFGVWPATKAARLNPVEALRYE
jgi:putative ABC transport system permease protein